MRVTDSSPEIAPPASRSVTTDHSTPATSKATKIAYQPGLDGLRGLGLVAVLVFHAGFTWLPGSFLAISMFFTLSGFLITTLLLAEHRRAGRIDIRAFWARRFRRLLPASLVVIAGILLASAVLADSGQLERLRGDVLATLAYVANWHFVSSGDSYGALFANKPPMEHFWSLAIEEQFYFVYPLVAAGVLACFRGSRRAFGVVLSVLIGCSITASIVLQARGASLDRLYFGTDVRAAEVLLGALVAVVWLRYADRIGAGGHRLIGRLGAIAFVAMLVSWGVAHRESSGWYRGGLTAYACVMALVILAAMQPTGLVRRVLGWRPFVLFGLISYGVYLIHWPVFVWLDERTGLAPWPLFALRVAVTLMLAIPMYLWIEAPIRYGRMPRQWRLAVVPLVVGGILVGAVVVPGNTVSQATEISRARVAFQHAVAKSAGERRHAVAAGIPTFAPFGDSNAAVDGFAIARWSYDHPKDLLGVEGSPALGCGTLEYERQYRGGDAPYPPECRNWIDHWRKAASASRPNIAVVILGPWEATNIRFPGESRWRAIGDPAVDARLIATLTAAVDTLFASGARKVVLVTSPTFDSGRVDGVSPPKPFPESDPSRIARWNAIEREVAATRPHVGVLDFAAYMATRTDDRRLRPDGVHFTYDTGREVADRLAPAILRLARTL